MYDTRRVEGLTANRLPVNRGITLVEVLVVIAIIGMLVALLLPAVQRAREAARRVGCQNNLRQLGLALHEYHDAHRKFPPGSINEWSWTARLLPRLEQNNLYGQFDFGTEPFEAPNSDKLAVVLPVLICPSDPYSDEIHVAESLDGIQFAHTNYLGSLDGAWSKGIFGFKRGIRVADVTDGTSQTLAVGERGVVSDGDDTYGWWTWGSGTTLSAVQNFGDGSYSTPGSIIHWWSYHPGGAQFLFVDSSVHFLSYSIDLDTFLGLGTKDGGDIVGSF